MAQRMPGNGSQGFPTVPKVIRHRMAGGSLRAMKGGSGGSCGSLRAMQGGSRRLWEGAADLCLADRGLTKYVMDLTKYVMDLLS